MASLGGQTIASSFEQILHVDNDGGGDTSTLVNVKDGDNGTTFALQLSNAAIKATGTLEVAGTSVFTGAILAPLTVGVSGGTSYDVKFWGDSAANYFLWDASNNKLNLAGEGAMLDIITTSNADTNPQLLVEGNTGGSLPHAAVLIEIKTNTDYRGKGITFTNADDNQEWFVGVPYAAANPNNRFVIGYHDDASALPFHQDNKLVTLDGTTGYFGVGGIPSYRLEIDDDREASYCARFSNDGNNWNRHGIIIQCGADDGSTSSATTYINFKDGDGTSIGSIQHSTGGDLVLNATSDARLKENIADTQLDGLSLCNQIKVREFNWKKKGGLKNRAGFIAQEVKSIFSEAVSGTDGAMMDKVITEEYINYDTEEVVPAVTERVIDPMGVADASFIPIMMKAIQQLSDKVTVLENA